MYGGLGGSVTTFFEGLSSCIYGCSGAQLSYVFAKQSQCHRLDLQSALPIYFNVSAEKKAFFHDCRYQINIIHVPVFMLWALGSFI